MIMTSDWPSIDPTADLFGGDLFGDELLDMYNPSVARKFSLSFRCDGFASFSLFHSSFSPFWIFFCFLILNPIAINNILPDEDGDDDNHNRHQGNDNDGLGALRPSNSINDFTSILEDNNTVLPSPAKVVPLGHNNNISTQAIVDPNAVTTTASGKKRPRDVSLNIAGEPSKKATTRKVAQAPVRVVPKVEPQAVVVPTAQAQATSAALKVAHQKVEDKSSIVAAVAQHVVATTVPVQGGAVATVAKTATTTVPSVHPATVTVQKLNPHVVSNAKIANNLPMPSDVSTASNNSAKTEESFKGVAQAAVTNLILSAGNNSTRKQEESDSFVKGVDTSTAHVAALTSNNWVAACAASISGAPPGSAQAAQAAALAAASDPAAAKAARARRATLTADERARQNRDRNREHARNTRLRKKAYVEELKRTLTELVSQRDASEVEKRHERQRDLEVREVRYRVMEEFLKLRARGAEQNLLARWIAILEDGFTLTLPKTTYRPTVNSELPRRVSNADIAAQNNDTSKAVLHNANQCFDDASKVASFVSSAFMGNAVQMTYHCERSNFMMDGVKAILDWTLKATPQTQAATTNAATSPSLTLRGCMKATFSPASNKLISAELLFDTGAVLSQLKSLKTQQSLCPIEETGALLDSVLPQVPSNTVTMATNTVSLPSTVSVVSTEKDASSDEEGMAIKAEPQTA